MCVIESIPCPSSHSSSKAGMRGKGPGGKLNTGRNSVLEREREMAGGGGGGGTRFGV